MTYFKGKKIPIASYICMLVSWSGHNIKEPQEIISGVRMLEGNITLPTRNLEGKECNHLQINVHRTHLRPQLAASSKSGQNAN